MINVDDLLKPIADGKPSGEDFTYHPSFQELEELAQGKPERVMGSVVTPAEDPKWPDVKEAAFQLLRQSMHLRAAFILTRALLKMGGIEGLRDGLGVMHGMTERFWPNVYPRLDPEDNNDPTERLNILNNLSSSKFGFEIQQLTLCESPLGRITLQQYLAAKERGDKAEGPGGGNAALDLNQINAALRAAPPENVKKTLVLVNQSIAHTQGLDGFLDKTLGAGNGVNFESLKKLLADMKKAVEPFAENSVAAPAAVGDGAAANAGAAGPEGTATPAARAVQGISGVIQTRGDVVKALNLICDYYRDHEKSSPVPLILQRAQRLVDKDFTSILSDLTPDALKQLQVITGIKPANKSSDD